MNRLITEICIAGIENKSITPMAQILADYLGSCEFKIEHRDCRKGIYEINNELFIGLNTKCIIFEDYSKEKLSEIRDTLETDIIRIFLKKEDTENGNIFHPREYITENLDISRELILIREPDTGKIIHANRKFHEMTGYSQNETQGMDYIEIISPEMRKIAQKRDEILGKEKYLTGEILYLKKDGQDLFVSLETIVTSDGKIIEFASDMTNWLNILSALSEGEYKFKQIFENSPVGKEIYNINGKLERLNLKSLEIYGISSRKDLKDWSLLEHVNLSQHQKDLLKQGEVLRVQVQIDFEDLAYKEIINTENRDKRFLDVHISKINISENRKNTYFLQYQDITGRKKYIEKLERQKERSEAKAQDKIRFISNMSHEIRTPLNTIIGMTELLGDTKLSPVQDNYIKILNKACDYLYAIINDILDLAKLDSGKLALEIRDFRLKELIEDIMEIFQFKAKEHNIKINLEYNRQIPQYIKGDTYRLRQVLFNLIGNAFKFTETGSIRIKADIVKEGKENKIMISVKDTGVGIQSDRLKTIFLPFAQESNSTVRKYGGTGLGLSICRMIVKKMGGKIWAESIPGNGAEFFFTFRYSKGIHDRQLELFDKEKEGKTEIKDRKILMIDDQEENRFLVSTYLKKIDITIDQAESGKDGLLKILENKYDMVITDIQMPDMDGFEVLKNIREYEKMAKIGKTIVIAVTAYAMKDELEEITKAGFDGYIPKPLKRNTFIESIKGFFEEKK